MKTVGILLLFGLCTSIGMRIASRRTERYRRIRSLRSELNRLSEAIGSAQTSLKTAADGNEGELFMMLDRYLSARNSGGGEGKAAASALADTEWHDAERDALTRFFTGLSRCSLPQIGDRTHTLDTALAAAEREAEKSAKQAKTIRAVGVLVGVGFCILLL